WRWFSSARLSIGIIADRAGSKTQRLTTKSPRHQGKNLFVLGDLVSWWLIFKRHSRRTQRHWGSFELRSVIADLHGTVRAGARWIPFLQHSYRQQFKLRPPNF